MAWDELELKLALVSVDSEFPTLAQVRVAAAHWPTVTTPKSMISGSHLKVELVQAPLGHASQRPLTHISFVGQSESAAQAAPATHTPLSQISPVGHTPFAPQELV